MSRAKRGFKARQRRKNVLKFAKGFRGSRKNRFKTAIHVVKRALAYAYRDRRVKKREFRKLWIIRINAAARAAGLRYGDFMHGLKLAGIELDRSVLADLAVHDNVAFNELVATSKAAMLKVAS
ncbi:MAG: 50S ribosomal protein L20 [Deltaproteobacteria bacterium]|nr:50S ribosomal protein L20 [Deltaproteobacteria bacterium]